MHEELTARGVQCINFYDVLIDFILLDAFEEVQKPPSSIKAILQNRWISASFRETVNITIFYVKTSLAGVLCKKFTQKALLKKIKIEKCP